MPIPFPSFTDQRMRLLDAVFDAAKERDLSSLDAAMQSLSSDHSMEEVQSLIRAEVLPRLDIRSLTWLWKAITSPLQRRESLSSMSNKTATKLCRDGFELGKDFSFLEDSEGIHRLKVNADTKHHLESTLTPSALASLQLLTRHTHVSKT